MFFWLSGPGLDWKFPGVPFAIVQYHPLPPPCVSQPVVPPRPRGTTPFPLRGCQPSSLFPILGGETTRSLCFGDDHPARSILALCYFLGVFFRRRLGVFRPHSLAPRVFIHRACIFFKFPSLLEEFVKQLECSCTSAKWLPLQTIQSRPFATKNTKTTKL